MKKTSLKIKKQREKPSALTVVLFVFLIIYIIGLFIPMAYYIGSNIIEPSEEKIIKLKNQK